MIKQLEADKKKDDIFIDKKEKMIKNNEEYHLIV